MGKIRNILAGAAASVAMAGSMLTPVPVVPEHAEAIVRPEMSGPVSIIRFDPEQRRFFEDESTVCVALWHRQKGKDYVTAAKAIKLAAQTGQNVYIVSMTQRQADSTFAKCKFMAKALLEGLRIEGEVQIGEGFDSDQYIKELDKQFVFKARELILPGGGRVISLPGRDPDSLAGLTGHIIFTEFGLFPNGGRDHWRVVYPLTTRGFRAMLISTPRGKDHKYYEICSDETGDYSVHKCTMEDSVRQGWSPDGPGGKEWTWADLEAFKRRYRDAVGWQREYMCEFSGDATALVPWSLLQHAGTLEPATDAAGNPIQCVYHHFDGAKAGEHASTIARLVERLRDQRLAIGWDVARKPNGDLAAISANILRPLKPAHLSLVITMSNCKFEFQRGIVTQLMDLSYANTGYGDETGLGMESNEILKDLYSYTDTDSRWTPVMFTAARKIEIASVMFTAFGDGMQTLPPHDGPLKLIATDIYALQRDETGSRMTIDELDNPELPDSHCDIAYSVGLAMLAGARTFLLPLSAPLDSKEGTNWEDW